MSPMEFQAAAEAAAVSVRGKAEVVVARLAARPGLAPLASDTPFLDLITDLLTQLLPVLIGCFGGAAGAAKELKNPRPLTRVRLRMAVRQELGDRRAFLLLGEPVVDAILAVGRETTAAELSALSS
jgi:hypothetical protein